MKWFCEWRDLHIVSHLIIRNSLILSIFIDKELSFRMITKFDIYWSEVKLLSCVRLFVTPWTVASQAPLAMELSKQEYWSG